MTGTRREPLLHVLASASFGGCERLTLDLAAHLAAAGRLQEAVLLRNGGGPVVAERLGELGVPVHHCPFPAAGRLGFVRAFARLCRRRGIGAVVSHAFGVHFYTALAARIGGVRRFLALAGNPPPRARGPRLASAVYAQAARPFVYREVAPSRYAAESMARGYRLPRRRLEVVPNWCDAAAIAAAAGEARSRRAESGPVVDPVVGTVARLDRIKDHPTVLAAFAGFAAAVPGAELRVVGDGPTRPRLEALAGQLGIADRVRFLGTRTDVPAQLGAMDLFLYGATRDEGFGIVLAEAMAAGTPIVCTDAGPCAEVLDGGRAGRLVPPGDAAAMAAAALALWRDPDARRRLAEEAGRLVRRRYAVGVGGQRILELLDE